MNYVPMDVAVQAAKLVVMALAILIVVAIVDYNKRPKPPSLKGRRE